MGAGGPNEALILLGEPLLRDGGGCLEEKTRQGESVQVEVRRSGIVLERNVFREPWLWKLLK